MRFTVSALLLFACTTAAAAQAPVLKYTVIQKYGWEDESEAPRPLSAKEAKLGGGVLGSVGTFAVGPDGRLYVPDGIMHKVVVFERNGALAAVWGGQGDGPGELREPFSIAVSPSGTSYVYDFVTKKVTAFSRTGVYENRFPFPGDVMSNIVWSNGSLFAARWVPDRAKVVVKVDPTNGAVRDSSVALTEKESKLYKFGGSMSMSATRDAVFLTSPNPGIWYSVTDSRAFGKARYPDARPYTRTIGSMSGVRTSTDRIVAFAARPDGSVVAVYAHRTKLGERAGENAEESTYLEIIRPNGSSGGRIEIPVEQRVFGAAVDGEDILLGVRDEIPQVWRLRLNR